VRLFGGHCTAKDLVKKVWLDGGQESKFNDPRVSKTSRGHRKDIERQKTRCSVEGKCVH
jgi:hypothetical protein